MNPDKIAFVQEYLLRMGGAERTLRAMHQIYPAAPIYSILSNESMLGSYFPQAEVNNSFLQRLPRYFRENPKRLLPFLPTAAESFDLREFPIVISSSSSFAKGVVTKPETTHICYCHAPMRFAWDWHSEYLREQKIGVIKKFFALPILNYLRLWDRTAAERVDIYIANSEHTARRIKKYYRRDSTVIYPPVDISSIRVNKSKGDYYLIVSRLTPYKRVDMAIEAFNKLELPLVVIGTGPQERELRRLAGPKVKLLGWRSDEVVRKYMEECRALIFPGEDDFGIVPVEAMAAGKPVLAYRKGGVTETVVEGVTGEYFDDPIVELLADGVRKLREKESDYDPYVIRKQAEKFAAPIFRQRFKELVSDVAAKIR